MRLRISKDWPENEFVSLVIMTTLSPSLERLQTHALRPDAPAPVPATVAVAADDDAFRAILEFLKTASGAATATIALSEGGTRRVLAAGEAPEGAGAFSAAAPVTLANGEAVGEVTIAGGPVRAVTDAEQGALVRAARLAGALLDGRSAAAALTTERERRRKTEYDSYRLHRMLAHIGGWGKIGAWSFDVGTQKLFWTEEMFALHGLSLGEPPNCQEFLEIYRGQASEIVRNAVEQAIQYGTPFEVEAEIVLGNGDRRVLHILGGAEVVDGVTSQLFGIAQDVTEIRSQESVVRWQSMMLDGAIDSVVVFDIDGRILYWNREAERVYGWSKAEAVGQDAASLIADKPEEHARIVGAVRRYRRWSGATTHRTRDGKALRVHGTLTLALTPDGDSEAILCIFSDTAARIALDDEMQRRSRLDAVVELTGGVAHDFNNLLTVILSGADLMTHRLDPDDERILPLVKMSRDAAERGRDLVNRMLAFARRQELEARTVDVNALVSNAKPLLQKAVSAAINVRIIRTDGLWKALVDPVKLESAILNLCINARDAMDDGSGRISIELSNRSIDAAEAAELPEVKPGDYVTITVTDDGRGMSDSTVSRVFEPFFTTKTGTGSGLGLSMVYGFVKQSEGHIQVFSEEGVGTTIRLFLPRSGVEGAAHGPDMPRGIIRGNGEVVLVVEDDAEVRAHVVMMLETLGYSVLEAHNGTSALGTLGGDGRLDLLFSDVVMSGGMSGVAVAERAEELRPEMPIVLTSGFARFPETGAGDRKFRWPLLTKPYTLEELSDVVHRSLSGTRRPAKG